MYSENNSNDDSLYYEHIIDLDLGYQETSISIKDVEDDTVRSHLDVITPNYVPSLILILLSLVCVILIRMEYKAESYPHRRYHSY